MKSTDNTYFIDGTYLIKKELKTLDSITLKKLKEGDVSGETFTLGIRYTILDEPFIEAIVSGSIKRFKCSKSELNAAKKWISKAWDSKDMRMIYIVI